LSRGRFIRVCGIDANIEPYGISAVGLRFIPAILKNEWALIVWHRPVLKDPPERIDREFLNRLPLMQKNSGTAYHPSSRAEPSYKIFPFFLEIIIILEDPSMGSSSPFCRGA